jgi:hypothetical protein
MAFQKAAEMIDWSHYPISLHRLTDTACMCGLPPPTPCPMIAALDAWSKAGGGRKPGWYWGILHYGAASEVFRWDGLNFYRANQRRAFSPDDFAIIHPDRLTPPWYNP